jgi:hypothetical protein
VITAVPASFGQAPIITIETGLGLPYAVGADGAGNIFYDSSGYIEELPPGTFAAAPIAVSGAGGVYPFQNPVVAINADKAGDVFVAVQYSVTAQNDPYFAVYELINGTSGYSYGGQVAGESTAPALGQGGAQTLNSMAYDNKNGLLYMNYIGDDETQTLTCANIVNGLGPPCGHVNQYVSPLNDNYANGLAVDGAGNVYTLYGTHVYIAQFQPGFSGGVGKVYSTESSILNGVLANGLAVLQNNLDESPVAGLAADDAGQIIVDAESEIFIYVPSFDSSNNPTGFYSPVAGTGTNGYNGDGTGPLHQINASEAATLDLSGNLWIADTNNGLLREVEGVATGEGAGTGVVSGSSPGYGCLDCGPQTLGNGTGGAGGGGNSAPTDTIPTNHFGYLSLLNSSIHKLYVAYPNALVVFDTGNDSAQITGSTVDVIPQDVTGMMLDPKGERIWAINSAGQVLAINSLTDQLIGDPIIASRPGIVTVRMWESSRDPLEVRCLP